MCGFAGILNPQNQLSGDRFAETINSMAKRLSHRGPDDNGVWVDPKAGMAFGHRRLSVIDLSHHGHQPMESHDGRYVIAYNGEIYNFRSLRKELEGEGIGFRGNSDTEVLLAGIGHWGLEGTLEKSNGMFAFGLWDRREKILRLVRDRLGEKPLYYGVSGGAFLFASELKAFKSFPGFSPSVNRNGLSLYLRHNYIPSPFSIYEGFFKLPPGSVLTLGGGAFPGKLPSPVPFWSPRSSFEEGLKIPDSGSDEEWISRMENLLLDSVKIRMESDVPLGAFLSGGIDSSAIVALMQAQSSRPVRTFTVGFREEGFNEAEAAGEVARHLGCDHTELYVTPVEAMEVVPKIPALYDEPFSDSSQIPTFLISQMARNHVTVCLSGDGGDEVFGGYNRYVWAERVWKTVGRLPGGIKSLMETLLTTMTPQTWNRVFGVINPFLPRGVRYGNPGDKIHKLAEIVTAENREEIYYRLVSHWKNPLEIVIGSNDPGDIFSLRDGRPETTDFTRLMMYLDMITYLPDDILVKVDRASMGVSLEGRIPFLDHRVVESSWGVPARMKSRAGVSKWLLREILYRYVPRELVDRPKMGFGVPIGSWLRGPLREWAEDLLGEDRLRREGYFNPGPIRRKWEEHLSGSRNWQYHLWDILMFQQWLASA